MDIVITLPKKVNWKEYLKELEVVKDSRSHLNFKVSNFPKDLKLMDRCYLCYKNFIIGYMFVTGMVEKEMICSTTGKEWKGKFIQRSGEFYKLGKPIPMKGFQGFRYYNESN